MIPAVVLLGAVTAERLAELWRARRNTLALLANGASEFAPGLWRAPRIHCKLPKLGIDIGQTTVAKYIAQ